MEIIHQVKFVEVVESHFENVLNMMESFNAIDDYKFDKEIGLRNLIEFVGDTSVGRIWALSVDKKLIGYIVLTLGYSFLNFKGVMLL